MFSEKIEVTVTFQQKVTFFLRMLSISEEQEFRQAVFGIAEKDRAEKEYWANISLLKELSVEMPVGLFPNEPETVSGDDKTVYAGKFKSAKEMIESFFAEKTTVKERIAYFAVRSFFIRLQPEESFF